MRHFKNTFLFISIFFALIGRTVVGIPDVKRPDLDAIKHAPPTGHIPEGRPPAAEDTEADDDTTAQPNEEFKKAVSDLSDQFYEPRGEDDKETEPRDKKPAPHGDEFDSVLRDSQALAKALEAVGKLELADGQTLQDALAAALKAEKINPDADSSDLEEHTKLLVGLAKLQEEIAGQAGLEDFSIEQLGKLTEQLNSDNPEEKKKAWAQIQALSAQLITMDQLAEKAGKNSTQEGYLNGAETFALRHLRRYLADQISATVDNPESVKALRGFAPSSPELRQAQDRWTRASQLAPGAVKRNTEVGRIFHGKAAISESAWDDAEPRLSGTEGQKTPRFQYRMVTPVLPDGTVGDAVPAFKDTASGQIFTVPDIDAYMADDKSPTRLDGLSQLRGNAALRYVGKGKEGVLVFEGFEQKGQDVAATTYRRLPKKEGDATTPQATGTSAVVEEHLAVSDGVRNFDPKLYVRDAALTHDRRTEGGGDTVHLGVHQRDSALTRAQRTATALNTNEGVPQVIKDAGLTQIELDGKKVQARVEGGLIQVFMGLDDNDKPVFFCANCQPDVAGKDIDRYGLGPDGTITDTKLYPKGKAVKDLTAAEVKSATIQPTQFTAATATGNFKPFEGDPNFLVRTRPGQSKDAEPVTEYFSDATGWVRQTGEDDKGNPLVNVDLGSGRKKVSLSAVSEHFALSTMPSSELAGRTQKDEVEKVAASATSRLMQALPANAQLSDPRYRVTVQADNGAPIPVPTASIGGKTYVQDYVLGEDKKYNLMWVPFDDWKISPNFFERNHGTQSRAPASTTSSGRVTNGVPNGTTTGRIPQQSSGTQQRGPQFSMKWVPRY